MPAPEKIRSVKELSVRSDLMGHFEIVADDLAAVKEQIQRQLTTSSESINALVSHIAAAGGKMLRPGLVLLAAKSCGNLTSSHIDIAAIVEMVHTATLLHDDVIDGASQRRRAATVNSLWGNKTAVLLGDLVLSNVFMMCQRLQSPQVRQKLSDVALRICQGELIQNLNGRSSELSREQYFDIVKDKTAALFECCCYLGSLAAEAGNEQTQRLSTYGLNLGMAFQISDDLLDLIGDEETEGKTLGTDLAEGKLTLPVIHLLSSLEAGPREELSGRLNGEIKLSEFRTMLEKAGSFEYTLAVVKSFHEKATEALSPLGDTDAKDALKGIADYVLARCGS